MEKADSACVLCFKARPYVVILILFLGLSVASLIMAVLHGDDPRISTNRPFSINLTVKLYFLVHGTGGLVFFFYLFVVFLALTYSCTNFDQSGNVKRWSAIVTVIVPLLMFVFLFCWFVIGVILYIDNIQRTCDVSSPMGAWVLIWLNLEIIVYVLILCGISTFPWGALVP